MRISKEALLKGVSTQFGPRTIEKCFFVWDGEQKCGFSTFQGREYHCGEQKSRMLI
jgi:hypothetical protein